MVMNTIKISQKMKTKSLLVIEKELENQEDLFLYLLEFIYHY